MRTQPHKPSYYKIIVEEWIIGGDDIGPIPADYKIYTFYGRTKMVFQLNRNIDPAGIAWFDGKFRLLRPGSMTFNPKHFQPDWPVLPRDWRALLKVAKRVSLALRTPFVRVDLYASDRGPLLGELTLTPGGLGNNYHPTPGFDAELGREWKHAALRIAADQEARDAQEKRGSTGRRRSRTSKHDKSGSPKPRRARKSRATEPSAGRKIRRP